MNTTKRLFDKVWWLVSAGQVFCLTGFEQVGMHFWLLRGCEIEKLQTIEANALNL